MSSSIPVAVLIQLEAERHDLAPLIHELMASNDMAYIHILEKRLAQAALPSQTLSAEQAFALSACLYGCRFGEVPAAALH